MNGFPNREIVERLRGQYPVGARVELVSMDDDYAPPAKTKGTVRGVDDSGSVMVSWDNGSSLSVVYGVDTCRRLDTVTTICYGKEELWDSREEAEVFYLTAIAGSEGSECERYTKIHTELMAGKMVCTDVE